MNCDYCGSKLKREPEMTEHWWYCPKCDQVYFVDNIDGKETK